MVARWMQAKLIKRKRERRAWAKPMSIKGSSPNWSNGVQYRDAPLDLNLEIQTRNEQETRKYRIPELSDLTEVRRDIDDPLFITPISNPAHRLRVYYNSGHTCFILQWVEWRKRQVRLSLSYPTFTMAYQRWIEDRVRWKSPKIFTLQ